MSVGGSCRAYTSAHLWATGSPRNPYILHQESRKGGIGDDSPKSKTSALLQAMAMADQQKVVYSVKKRLERSGVFRLHCCQHLRFFVLSCAIPDKFEQAATDTILDCFSGGKLLLVAGRVTG